MGSWGWDRAGWCQPGDGGLVSRCSGVQNGDLQFGILLQDLSCQV